MDEPTGEVSEPIQSDEERSASDDEFDEDAAIAEAGAAFDRVSRDGRTQDLIRTLDLYLRREVTSVTYPEMSDALETFLSRTAIAFLLDLTTEPPRARIGILEGLEWTEPAKELVHAIVGPYGEELAFAFNMWPRSGRTNDWMALDHVLMLRRSPRMPIHRFEITKRNRETVVIEGTPASITRLARRLIAAVATAHRSEEFDLQAIERLEEAVERLRAKAIASQEHEEAE
jgi:hypothetical protein